MPIANLSNSKLNYLQINHQINDEKTEDIVMIHGLATNLAFWYPIANNLVLKNQENRLINTRITLYDLLGHGRSSMPESGYTCTNLAYQLWELTEYLNIDKFHLIAHSFGGSIAVDFVNLFPEKVKSLVLADVRLKILQPQQILRNWQNWQVIHDELNKLNLILLLDEPEAGIKLLTAIAKLTINQREINSDILAKLIPLQQNIQTAQKWLKLMETTKAMTEFSEYESITQLKLKQFTIHSLLIYGDKSPNLTTKTELEKLLSFYNSYLVTNAGHFFPLSQPQIIIEKIIEFLRNKK